MISGEVMPVIGKWLNYMSRLHDGVDAILIADRHGTTGLTFTGMDAVENGLADEGFIGKNILEAYPQLTEETSSHFRVMRTGAPVLNEKQELTDFYGRRTILVSSTFPLEYSGELIGTMETSVFYHKDAQLDGKNHWLANPHKGLFRLDDIITQNPAFFSAMSPAYWKTRKLTLSASTCWLSVTKMRALPKWSAPKRVASCLALR